MPEIKNTFLAGKMNKSLDDRIIPQGEYRDALNVQVTKADGPDVGVIHNIKGNTIVASLGLGNGYEVIGSFFDEKNNIIYWFVTDNNHSYVYKFDKNSSTTSLIASSSSPDNWLNFNKDYKITGINLLEDLLFWTDGLNQPRRINVTRADGSYYDSEIKVSVAKYAPYLPPQITAVEHDDAIKSKRIEEEFVRFAYRYKFKDNEYSVLSPFTPIVFEMETNLIDTTSNYFNTSDLKVIGSSTEIPLMTNNINKITMNIPIPTETNGTLEDYEIKEIDILYKESDSNAIRIIETINISAADTSGNKQYIYKSSNFKATLPEDQLTRVFDAVPVKAQAQEVAGNRVIYGNITNKKDLPDIDFAVSYDNKVTTNPAVSQQSVKQRRTYEVGIVLSDRFGRTSPVITSDSSTIYVGAKDRAFNNTGYSGSSLNIIFKSITDPDGTIYNASTNPNGWYSYKVVIKQKEQEYYNVYTPGSFYFGGSYRSYITIHGDNINKVPRDTIGNSNTIDENIQFTGAQVRIYPKVLNVYENNTNTYRNSGFDLLEIVKIGNKNNYSGQIDSSTKMFESTNNHLIGQIEGRVGVDYTQLVRGGDFAVFETEPFESALDIYYETPTSDLISNIDLDQFDIVSANRISFDKNTSDTSNLIDEDVEARDRVARLYARKSGGGSLPSSMVHFEHISDADADGNETNNFGVRFNSGEGEWELYAVRGLNYKPALNDNDANTRNINLRVSFLGTQYATEQLTIYVSHVQPVVSGSAQLVTFNTDGTASSGVNRETTITQNAGNVLFKIYGAGGGKGASNLKEFLNFDLLSIENVDGSAWPTSANPLDFFSVIQNTDYTLDENGNVTTSSTDGVGVVIYHQNNSNQGIPNNTGHHNNTFRFGYRSRQDLSVWGVNITGEELSETAYTNVHFTDTAALSSANSGFELYYAPPETFANAYQACEDPLNGNWSEITVYYPGSSAVNDYPFIEPNFDSNPQVLAKRMYYDSRLSRPALPGWYKKPEERLIGFYYISGNEPETFNGWWYDTPDVCGSFSKQDAEDATSYNPPEDVNYEEDDGENPYDLPTFNPKPEP